MKNNKKLLITTMLLGILIAILGTILLIVNFNKTEVYFDESSMAYPEQDLEEKFLGAGMLFVCIILIGFSLIVYSSYSLYKGKIEKVYTHTLIFMLSLIASFGGMSYIIKYQDKVLSRISKAQSKLEGLNNTMSSDKILDKVSSANEKLNEITTYPKTIIFLLVAILGALALGISSMLLYKDYKEKEISK
jgi:hypothetical protein